MDRFYKAYFFVTCSILLGFTVFHFAVPPEGEDIFDFSEIAQIVSGAPYEVDGRDGKKAIIALNYVGVRLQTRRLEVTDKTTVSISARSPLITDKEMELLKQFPNTVSLTLNCTNITDKGLRQIAELKKLGSLTLHDYSPTTSSNEALETLQKQLPNLEIDRNGRSRSRLQKQLSDLEKVRNRIRLNRPQQLPTSPVRSLDDTPLITTPPNNSSIDFIPILPSAPEPEDGSQRKQ